MTECVLTAEQLELLTSTESRSKLPSISGEHCGHCTIRACSVAVDGARS